MVLEGRELAREERRRRRLPAGLGAHLGEGPVMMVDWHGDECGLGAGVLEAARRRLRGKRDFASAPQAPEAPGDEAAARPAWGPPPLEDADAVLLVAELHAGGGLQLGDEVAATSGDVAVGSKVIGSRHDGRPVLCERVAVGDVAASLADAFANAGRAAGRGALVEAAPPAAEAPLDLRDLARAGPAGVGGVETPREGGDAVGREDVRALSMEWNEQGARFKEWRRAVGESCEEPLDGLELRGAGTALHLCQRFAQHGGDPKT
ncbi:unnamed protein product [Prorocentrum cordatum]|uniref:Uncharacterized protein n=1 Tax=Prorocentrum cordatum TaxID=2364126 RepID=A0ABN9QYJ8_9DINO|nr:unnamed protein product [Polarella glacialis]